MLPRRQLNVKELHADSGRLDISGTFTKPGKARAPNLWDRSRSFWEASTFGILSVAKPLNLQEVGDMVVNLGAVPSNFLDVGLKNGS